MTEPPTLETPRLTLRGFVDADVDAMTRVIMADPDVMATLPEDPQTPEAQRACAVHYIGIYTVPWHDHGWGGWAVCARDAALATPGTLIGFCGLEAGQLEGEGPELGYGFGKAFWGKGLASEAAGASVDWIATHTDLASFYACIEPKNRASGRILEKVGMVYVRDEDIWDSVKLGIGLIPLYVLDCAAHRASLERDEVYLNRIGIPIGREF